MALGPKGRERAMQVAIKNAEKRIDQAIIEQEGQPSVRLDTRELPGLASTFWFILHTRYKIAGWKRVEWKTDTRDGDYIELTPP